MLKMHSDEEVGRKYGNQHQEVMKSMPVFLRVIAKHLLPMLQSQERTESGYVICRTVEQ